MAIFAHLLCGLQVIFGCRWFSGFLGWFFVWFFSLQTLRLVQWWQGSVNAVKSQYSPLSSSPCIYLPISIFIEMWLWRYCKQIMNLADPCKKKKSERRKKFKTFSLEKKLCLCIFKEILFWKKMKWAICDFQMYVERTFIRKRSRWRPVKDYLRKQMLCWLLYLNIFRLEAFGIAITG